MTGRPDWQEVPRGFSAREVLNELVDIGAGSAVSRTIPAADTDDVVGVYVEEPTAVVVWVDVLARTPLGDVAYRLRDMTFSGSSPLWFPIAAAGGSVTVTLRDVGAAAHTDIVLRAWSYIGVRADDITPVMSVHHQATGTVVAGGSSVIELANCTLLTAVSWVANFSQTFTIRSRPRIPNSDTAPTNQTALAIVHANGAAGANLAGTFDLAAPMTRLDLLNTSGASGSGNLAVVQRRP